MKLSYSIRAGDTREQLQSIESEIALSESPKVELFLDEVDSLSLPLLIGLVRLVHYSQVAGGSCSFVNASIPVRRSLQAAGFHRVVPFEVH